MQSAERILDAAERRFADYGYAKTTMAEIARDAQMSVGNLYRFFRNKEALLAASLERLLQRKLRAGIEAASREADPFAALHAFLLTRLRIAHGHFADTRHLFDMIRIGAERHAELLLAYEQQVIDALAAILARGRELGRFAIDDVHQTAYDLHQATLRYNHPLALRRNPLPRLEEDLARLLALLDRGLQPRSEHHDERRERP